MKRLIVVCEGPTEKEFCKNVLQNFFWQHGIVLETPVVKHSGGGVVPWPTLKVQSAIGSYLGKAPSIIMELRTIFSSLSGGRQNQLPIMNREWSSWRKLCCRMSQR